MEKESQRISAWRDQKRHEGYLPLTIWLKADIKHLIEDLASDRREEPSAVVAAAMVAFVGHESRRPQQVAPDYQLIRRLIREEMAAALGATPPQASLTPSATGRRLKDPAYGSLTRAIYEWGPKLRTFTNKQMAQATGGSISSTHTALTKIQKRGHVEKKGYVWTWLLYEGDQEEPGDGCQGV